MASGLSDQVTVSDIYAYSRPVELAHEGEGALGKYRGHALGRCLPLDVLERAEVGRGHAPRHRTCSVRGVFDALDDPAVFAVITVGVLGDEPRRAVGSKVRELLTENFFRTRALTTRRFGNGDGAYFYAAVDTLVSTGRRACRNTVSILVPEVSNAPAASSS